MKTIDLNIAKKVLETVDAGLVRGMGNRIPGQMCVEAAVCYALDLPHGDNPECVAPTLRYLKIRLNDSNWSSAVARSKGLRRLALAQLGSAGVLDEKEFSRRVARLAMQNNAPKALRAVADLFRDGTATKERLLNTADLCESGEVTQDTAKEMKNWASDIRSTDAAAYATADDATTTYATTNYIDAADTAADVAAAVADTYTTATADTYTTATADIEAAAHAATAAAASSKFWGAYWKARANGGEQRDAAIAMFCEGIVQILIEMKAPGCQWLSITESV